jgi:hypothetical protein
MKLLSFGFLAISFLFSTAQEEIITYGEASQLPISINSTQDDIMPLVSSDGQTLFFVRDEGEETKTGQNIFRSIKTENGWGEATIKTSHLNNKQNNAVVGISKDGSTLYLVDAYKKYNDTNQGIAISKLDGKKWSKPEYLEISGMNYLANHFYGFYVNPEETVMLLSMVSEHGKGKEDLHISLKEGDSCWSTPKSLGENVNSEGYEMSPFLTTDNNRIYFSSNGFGGEGDADVFYIDKLGDDWFTWSNPINLGANVNSAGFDAYFSIGQDNLAYFSSNRNDGQNDIFTTQITIEVIGEEPVVEEPVVEEPVVEEVVVEEPVVEEPVVEEPVVEEPVIEEPVIEEPIETETKPQEAIYTVQVAAYKNASNYDASHLASFGKIEKVILDDGITRFTLGEFNTLNEAIQYKEQIINKGQPDAFVIKYSEGKRTYPELDNGASTE